MDKFVTNGLKWKLWSELDDSTQLASPLWLWSEKYFPSSDGDYPLGGCYKVLWHLWSDTKGIFERYGVTHYVEIPTPPVCRVAKLKRVDSVG